MKNMLLRHSGLLLLLAPTLIWADYSRPAACMQNNSAGILCTKQRKADFHVYASRDKKLVGLSNENSSSSLYQLNLPNNAVLQILPGLNDQIANENTYKNPNRHFTLLTLFQLKFW